MNKDPMVIKYHSFRFNIPLPQSRVYPFSLHFDESFSLLSEIYINKENYNATIDAIKKISELNNKQKFNLAYSYFQIDSLETSRYHFSSLLSVDSDYQSASKYYFALVQATSIQTKPP